MDITDEPNDFEKLEALYDFDDDGMQLPHLDDPRINDLGLEDDGISP